MKGLMNTNCRMLAVGILATAGFISCNTEDPIPGLDSGYVVGLRAFTGGDEEADYLLLHPDLMEETLSSTGQGLEQTGWCYYSAMGDRYFSFNYDQNICTGYQINNGRLSVVGEFVFERMDCMNPGEPGTIVAIGAPWGGGSYDCQIQFINVDDVSISKTVLHPIYESFIEVDSLDEPLQLNAWPTHSYVENGKLFVSFYPLEGASWLTPLTDTAYVSVFSYPELDYLKTFKDVRAGPIGYYGSQPGMMEDENGDHYTISTSSYLAGFTQRTKPSGILRIKAGADEFDETYFFDVESASGGYKLLTAAYVGNGKAIARVADESGYTVDDMWGAFSYSELEPCEIAVLDLEAKTVTLVDDVPLHRGQYQTPFHIEDGQALISVNDGDETYVYAIDPETATATRGARIIGREFQAIYKF